MMWSLGSKSWAICQLVGNGGFCSDMVVSSDLARPRRASRTSHHSPHAIGFRSFRAAKLKHTFYASITFSPPPHPQYVARPQTRKLPPLTYAQCHPTEAPPRSGLPAGLQPAERNEQRFYPVEGAPHSPSLLISNTCSIFYTTDPPPRHPPSSHLHHLKEAPMPTRTAIAPHVPDLTSSTVIRDHAAASASLSAS